MSCCTIAVLIYTVTVEIISQCIGPGLVLYMKLMVVASYVKSFFVINSLVGYASNAHVIRPLRIPKTITYMWGDSLILTAITE